MSHDPAPRFITIGVADPDTRTCYEVTVPGRSTQEALTFLEFAGGGMFGSGGRQVLAGMTLAPIRNAYYRRLAEVEREIAARRAALGSAPSEAALKELGGWAVRQRAAAARLWRVPSGPAAVVIGEARDWREYGPGGRTVGNMERRVMSRGLRGAEVSEYFLKGAVRPNAKMTTQLLRGARFLRRGGGILAVAGLMMTEEEIRQAPAGQRTQIAKQEAVGMAGGFIGGEAAVGSVLAIGTAFALATPPGWVLLGIGIIAGAGGSYVAEKFYFHDDGVTAVRAIGRGETVGAGQLMPFCPSR
jgi:hypothetical protein